MTTTTLHVRGVVGPTVLPASQITLSDGLIVAVEPLKEGHTPLELTAVGGFIDMHCHGGAGHHFAEGGDAARAARRLHLEHGTTTMLASLVSASPANLRAQVVELCTLVDDGTFAGIHLEGPWIQPRRRGAHDASTLREPTGAEIATLLEEAGDRISMVTLAPELPGAREMIGALVSAGIVVAVGHTDATSGITRGAIDAGATVATHLFNAMPPLGHREPGPVASLLQDPRVTVELIADTVHLHPDVLAMVLALAGADRIALVTDAMAAAGAADGPFELGSLAVIVTDGIARTVSDGALAGSTLTMDSALRHSVRDAGWSLQQAVMAMTVTPARTLGLTDRGVLAPGMRGDVVLLDDELTVRGVIQGGEWIVEPT